MGLRDDWERRRAARSELRADLGAQAGNAFLTYAQTPRSSPEHTAATNCAALVLGMALAGATVECERTLIPPAWLRDLAFDLYRRGEHLSRIVVDADGPIRLIRQSSWSWIAGDADPRTWVAQSTETGPHTTTTRTLPHEALVRIDWHSEAGSPYIGRPPTHFARPTADLANAGELSLGREAGGDVGRILPMPQAATGPDSTEDVDNDDDQRDPMAGIRDDLAAAKGRTLLVESTSNNYDEGGRPPQDDWKPRRIGPDFTAAQAQVATDAHHRLLNTMGLPIGLVTDSDGTSQREGLRRWHMGVVEPVARLIEFELADKLSRSCKIKFDPYPFDMVSRATVVQKLVDSGVDLSAALAAVEIE